MSRGSPRRQPPGQGQPPPGGQLPPPQQASAAAQRIGGYYGASQPHPPQPYAAASSQQQPQQQQQYPYAARNYPQHVQQPTQQPPPQQQPPLPQQPQPFPYYHQGQTQRGPTHAPPSSQIPQQQQQQQQTSPYRTGPAHLQPSPIRNPYPSMPGGILPTAAATGGIGGMGGMEIPPAYIQPRVGRLPKDRPIVKLSVSLIDTYKEINRVYYREREARRAARQAAAQQQQQQQQASASASASASQPPSQQGPGTQNNGWDDDNFDYILTPNETIQNRYVLQKRIGKGSFGQVVQALDKKTNKEVAIKIIKSKKPFLMQARTEIELLTLLNDNDREDQHNIVRLLTHFMHRNHQCLVFEMLSLNLYELLKNTHFAGVSLNLIRKFAKQILKALSYLSRPDIDVIHCDLKPENILLRHPKRSGIKVIDFGSSCNSSRRMYSYIQSRFYRSPEVMLGLPYSVAIDMWSLGCILVEMHTGEPLFSGTDQFDQMQKIVSILGMVPSNMLDKTDDQHRIHFFEQRQGTWTIKQTADGAPLPPSATPITPSSDPIASLKFVVSKEASQKKAFSQEDSIQTARAYDRFVDLIHRMLAYNPRERITPGQALEHPFITNQDLG
ncbi:hypothetical protein HJC23_005485 [Cyclotella cryptica]|uniref:Protein kinase domain-containing protein n=1 Tax=Cyclotella cryptica TaxID=29204 RepID=A0ABD3PH58_9STRA